MEMYMTDIEGHLCFSAEFFQNLMASALGNPGLQVISAHYDLNAYQTETAKKKYIAQHEKIRGLFKYRIVYRINGQEKTISILLKSKTSYKEFLEMLSGILLKTGISLDKADMINYFNRTALYRLDVKEIKLYQLALKNNLLNSFFPTIYGTYLKASDDDYIILEEYLKDAYIMSDYQDLSFWSKDKITQAIIDLSRFHAIFYENFAQLADEDWMGELTTAKKMVALMPVWKAFANNLRSYENNLFTPFDVEQHFKLIDSLPTWWSKIDAMPKTLIYNDLQIRNIAMRQSEKNWKLCLYDWEVATIHIPQRDVVEFLSYLITVDVTDQDLKFYLEISRSTLSQATHQTIDPNTWLWGCLYALYDYQIDRLAVQLNFHKVIQRVDIDRVWRSSRRLLKMITELLNGDGSSNLYLS